MQKKQKDKGNPFSKALLQDAKKAKEENKKKESEK